MRLSWRIADGQYGTDEQFQRVLAFLQAHPSAFGEINMGFETKGNAYPDEAAMEARVGFLQERIQRLHAAGVGSVGITMGWTLGHGDASWGMARPAQFRAAVGHDGQVSTSCPCPSDETYRDYVATKYAWAARSAPDFIDVDDDTRASHHGPTYPCFCEGCLARFDGGRWERAALVARLDAPDGGELREAWIEFQVTLLEELFARIGQAVREVSPEIALGYMSVGPGHSTYSGQAYARWMQALGASRGRPGWGYYTDDRPRDMLHKAMEVGRQARGYGQGVTYVSYEMENYPHVPLEKSTRALVSECTLAIMQGCNELSYALTSHFPGRLEDYSPDVRAIAAHRKLWEELERRVRGLPLAGLWPAAHDRLMARRAVRDGEGWFWEHGPYDLRRAESWCPLGIATSTEPDTACGTLLAGRIAEAFTDDELRAMLARGVIMDGQALTILWERGLGELAGVRPGAVVGDAVYERATDDAWNAGYEGDGRNSLISDGDPCIALEPLGGGVRILSEARWFDDRLFGPCVTAHENELGGRVAVATYAPWSRLGWSWKLNQMRRLAAWVTHDRLPLAIRETVRVAPFVRSNAEGTRWVAALLNNSLDPTGPVTVRVQGAPSWVRRLTPTGYEPVGWQREEGRVVVWLEDIAPWDVLVLVGGSPATTEEAQA